MSRIALLYMTREGQTRKIIKEIGDQLEFAGHKTFISDIRELSQGFFLSDFDSVVLGCSIRYGKHHKPFCRFIDNNQEQLTKMPGYFFSVNLTARKPGRSQPSNNRYLQKYLRRISWQPQRVEVFAGALLYPRYGMIDRRMIQLIMRITGGPIDPSQETEFTDWERVREFACLIDQDLQSMEVSLPELKPVQEEGRNRKREALTD